MTRFDADDAAERRKLFADAIRAHRTRNSPFLTVEVDTRTPDPTDAGSDADDDILSGTVEDMDSNEEIPAPPWIQYAHADSVLNLDCTDSELARLKDLVTEYPSFRIDDLTRPPDADRTNARVSTRVDPKRIADFLDDAFQRVYERPADYRAWVVQV